MELDKVFADLEIQLLHELESGVQARLIEEERHRLAQLTVRKRCVELATQPLPQTLRVQMNSGLALSVVLKRVGKDWCSVQIVQPLEYAGEALLALNALSVLTLSKEQAHMSSGTPIAEVSQVEIETLNSSPTLTERITLRFLLRDLSKRRKHVTLLSTNDRYVGRLESVGADHVEISLGSSDTALVSLAHLECVLLEARR